MRFTVDPEQRFPAVPGDARVVLLMRGWHPDLQPAEREAMARRIREGGEEFDEGYTKMELPEDLEGWAPLPEVD